MRIGYACINMTLAEEKIQVNRSMVKKTFLSKGISYASELALKNVNDLEKVIDWNIENQLSLYRMSSDMFPWMSEYELKDLPDYQSIKNRLEIIGEKVRLHKLRLTYHPGPFNVLASNNESVLQKTIKELSQHGEIMDMIGLPRSPFAKINIHIGGAYGDKSLAIQRFIKNFSLLPESVKTRLTIENDDKASMYSVNDLMEVHNAIGIPVVFDYLHHKFCTGGLSEQEAMVLAYSTWPKDILPIVHYSSSKKIFEDPSATEASHADYVYEYVNTYGLDVDIMLEAKAKEKAIQQYVNANKIKLEL
jgi:UV DNA damage endonuclease